MIITGMSITYRDQQWKVIRTWHTTDPLLLIENDTGTRLLTTEARVTADQEATRTRDHTPAD